MVTVSPANRGPGPRIVVGLIVCVIVLAVVLVSGHSSTTVQSAKEPVLVTAPAATAARTANRPDPALSPGAIFPDVTAERVCVAGYSASVRNVPQSLKEQVFAEYGITAHPSGAYEIDHLVSLELGGSNDIGNLWPEPYQGDDNAHVKDVLENRFHSMVCGGAITLAEAQARIVHWWDFE